MILATRRTLGETDVWSLSPYFRHRNLFNKRLEYQSQCVKVQIDDFAFLTRQTDILLTRFCVS